ncbi:MAG: ATP-dependent Clp protease ATP-binding subunit [Candidatus Kerfeldbacteria bacterium]|nr:ATP-dependent Clp protease ATP-binding subunit [Candidatus Kerfeldbacteria bacterium]
MNPIILEKFTTHLRNVLSRSITLAAELHSPTISPVVLLFALSTEENSMGARMLERMNISPESISMSIDSTDSIPNTNGKKTTRIRYPEFSDYTKRLIQRAAIVALEFRHAYIGTEHLLFAVLQKPDEQTQQLLQNLKLTQEVLFSHLLQMMNSTSKFSEVQTLFRTKESGDEHTHPTSTTTKAREHEHTPEHVHEGTQTQQLNTPSFGSPTPALEYFGEDLTSPAKTKTLDPVIGRSAEIERLIHILARRSKNNPVLIGEPGVGKTAIVEGLAKRIAEQHVPQVLADKRIIALDLGLVIAGTMYRGEFESRMKQIIEEVNAHPEIILFIDEVHLLVGTGGTGGTMDAANMLKPALAKGELRCIGATTKDEYRKYIEADPALDRRFQPIHVAEPTAEEAIEMLNGVKHALEKFHHITIPTEVIQHAVTWAARFIPDKRLPDKAIDLLDEAGARTHSGRNVPKVMKEFRAAVASLHEISQKKNTATRHEEFDTALRFKKQETALNKKIARLQVQLEKLHIPTATLSSADVAAVLSASTGIPVEHITANHNIRLGNVEKEILRSIVGQDNAVKQVTAVIKRSYAGLASPHKPLGSFLFLGPSGVGKTALAKALAEQVFGSSNALIRLDMSEFAEGFTVSKLIGAPAGYVGHKDSVKLADQIRRQPYSVVLFDEIEKAHPDIFNLLLQVLDDGRLTDGSGRELNFRQSIIILTSNVGIDMLNKQAALGFAAKNEAKQENAFEELSTTILAELPNYFAQEFLNRIDHQIVFHPLNQKQMERIVQMQFAHVAERVANRDIRLELPMRVRRLLAKESFSPEQGARLVQRTLTRLIENPLADHLLAGDFVAGDMVTIQIKKKKLIFSKK